MLRETLIKSCYAGGEVMKSFMNREYKICYKKDEKSIVTDADRESERAIIQIISDAFPEHDILSEESGEIIKGKTDYKWIVDPIDGTTNFANKNPLCCVSIGLLKENQVVLGGVYHPFMNELFIAEKGKGAVCNDIPICINAKPDIEHCAFSIVLNHATYGNDSINEDYYRKLFRHKIHSRKTGASALDLCWTAMGRLDAFVSAYSLNIWDIIAGVLMVQEAGGVVKNFTGEDFSAEHDHHIIAGNPELTRNFLNKIILS